MDVKVISPDTQDLPIDLELTKNWLRIDVTDAVTDALLTVCLKAAIKHCENFTGLSFTQKTYEALIPYVDYINRVELPHGPNIQVASVSTAKGNVIISDAALGSTWLAEYLKGMSINNTYAEDYGFWSGYDALGYYADTYYKVTYTAGYEAGKLPEDIVMAVLKQAADLYENRGNTVVGMTVVASLNVDSRTLLTPYKKQTWFI